MGFKKKIFIGHSITIGTSGYSSINFSDFKNKFIKNEFKFYICFSFKNNILKNSYIAKIRSALKNIAKFIYKNYNDLNSLNDIDKNELNIKYNTYLLSISKINSSEMSSIFGVVDFIKEFYDDREETEKDIWYSKNIKGAKIPASGANNAINNELNFNSIPNYYRSTVKRYFKTIITKKSWNHCHQILQHLRYFFRIYYSNNYTDGFIENLSRDDIENYLYWLGNDYKDKNPTYRCKFISYIRTFLEYIQIAQYDKAPKKEVSFLIFQDDIPKRS